MDSTTPKSWKKINEFKKLKKKLAVEKKLQKALKEQSALENQVQTSVDFSETKNLKTVSIAVAGSILGNAQSHELRTYLAGQVARAAAIYQVDEVVIFNDMGDTPVDGIVLENMKNNNWRCVVQFGRLLQYLECPQYLRKQLFPVHKDLVHAGLLNPLDTPHHLRADEDFPFREGVVTSKPVKSGKGSYVDIGLLREASVDKVLNPGTRVTVKLLPNEGSKKIKGLLVPPTLPKVELGVYWGYEVRLAKKLSDVFNESPYDEGYDLLIGTSDKGTPIRQFKSNKDYKHCMIVFGGVQGLEAAFESDESCKAGQVADLFNHYINSCPSQGSRTIRTEEAVLITLAQLMRKVR